MVKMKIFNVYLDNGRDVFKVRVPAFDEKQAIDYCDEGGEVIAVREETEIPYVCCHWLAEELRKTDMTAERQLLIARIVENCGLGY